MEVPKEIDQRHACCRGNCEGRCIDLWWVRRIGSVSRDRVDHCGANCCLFGDGAREDAKSTSWIPVHASKDPRIDVAAVVMCATTGANEMGAVLDAAWP